MNSFFILLLYRTKWRPIFVCLVVVGAWTNCTGGYGQQGASKNTDTGDAFLSLLRSSEDGASASVTPQLLERLRNAARREPWAGGADIDMAIMLRYPEERFSLFLLEYKIIPMRKDMSAVEQFVTEVHMRAPGSALEAKAVALQLACGLSHSYAQYLPVCNRLIEGDVEPRVRRAALFARLEYYAGLRMFKPCASDAMELWVSYPETVERARLGPLLTHYIRSAGFALEAEMLSTSSRPAAVCALLLEQSGQLLATDGRSAGIGNQTSTTAYWGGAPELDAIISDAKHIQLVPEDEAVF